MADEIENKRRARSIIIPAILATVLTGVLSLAMPDVDWRVYLVAWVGTFFSWSIWTYIYNMG